MPTKLYTLTYGGRKYVCHHYSGQLAKGIIESLLEDDFGEDEAKRILSCTPIKVRKEIFQIAFVIPEENRVHSV